MPSPLNCTRGNRRKSRKSVEEVGGGGMGNTLLTEVGVIPRWCSPQSALYYILSPFSSLLLYSFPLSSNAPTSLLDKFPSAWFFESHPSPVSFRFVRCLALPQFRGGGIIENYFRPFYYSFEYLFFLSFFFLTLCFNFFFPRNRLVSLYIYLFIRLKISKFFFILS